MRLTLISVGPPYRGGISDLSALIYHELKRQHTLQFINYSRQYPKFLFPGKTEYKVGASASDLSSERLIDSLNPLSWYRAVKVIVKFNPDAVIFRYWNPFFAILINVMSRRLKKAGIKVTVLVDNLIPHEESRIDSLMAKRILANADLVFSMSRSVSRDVERHSSRVRPVTLFHPLYEIYQPQFSRSEARAKLGLGKGPVALYFGLIRPYKGLDILIKALGRVKHELPDLFTFILGEAYEDEQQYRDLIVNEGIEAQTMFKNAFVADDDLPLYFAACDVLVLPYRTATQSGIVGIAFQMDRPVIATQVGGLGEYIDEGETGYLVPPEDPERLGQSIVKFFAGDDRERMPGIVHERRDKLSIKSFCEQIVKELGHD